jgi:NAD(P)-dependent dehydrogenase (short-subunit alcohol dehydrogenase family)
MRIIVTGGGSGLGKGIVSALAGQGHSVLIACRTVSKGEAAAAEIGGDVEVAYLDLADLASIRAFAKSVESVDVLINNAGVLGLPLTRTADGFEAHIGTNHLGHFALTCLLADRIAERVISVSSASYALGNLDFSDLDWHSRTYRMFQAYSDSKLAVMLFVAELARRGIRAYASDPGMVASDITRDAVGVLHWAGKVLSPRVAMPPAKAALSTLQALTSDLPSGTYFAPWLNQWGKPRVTKPRRKATNPDSAGRLWELSAKLTGCDL